MVRALNTISGQISDVSPKTLLHPTFKDILIVVDEDRKPYEPKLYKGGTVEEKKRDNKRTSRKKKSVEEESVVIEDEPVSFFFNDEVTEEKTQTEEDK
jgi:hypothetical protein